MIGERTKEKKINKKIFVFHLYVTGASPNSLQAIQNIKSICEKYLGDKYELEVIDVYQTPGIAKRENIIALPLLIKKFPLPETRFIGNISDAKHVLEGIGYVLNSNEE